MAVNARMNRGGGFAKRMAANKNTRPWSQTTVDKYRALPLLAHDTLADVPVHDVWRVFLPGGGDSVTMLDVRRVSQSMRDSSHAEGTRGGGVGSGVSGGIAGLAVRTLFAIRHAIGALFGWDDSDGEDDEFFFDEEVSRATLVPRGTRDGPFTVVYVYDDEALSAIRNATVEAYLVWSLQPVQGGHDLLWAIHVRSVGALTRPYMMVVDPFRKWLVYPQLLQALHDAWVLDVIAREPDKNTEMTAE